MAESSFSRLDHRAPLARPEITRTGAGWDAVAGRVDRQDARTHFPLSVPVEGMEAPPPEEPRPPPAENELRATLRECLLARDFSAEQLARAEATVGRAAQHVERCRERLQTFAHMDDETTAALLAALRDGGRPDQDDAALRQRRAEAQIAGDDLRAAERAADVLGEARDVAQADAEAATRAARTAAVAVLAIQAEQLGQRVADLDDEAERSRQSLVGFDRVNAAAGLPLPPAVFKAIAGDAARLLKPTDSTAWRTAIDTLLGDAAAEIKVPLPERRPAPVLARYSPEVRIMVPIRPLQTEPVTEPVAEAATEPAGVQTDIPERASEGGA